MRLTETFWVIEHWEYEDKPAGTVQYRSVLHIPAVPFFALCKALRYEQQKQYADIAKPAHIRLMPCDSRLPLSSTRSIPLTTSHIAAAFTRRYPTALLPDRSSTRPLCERGYQDHFHVEE